jgi:hypothetical protein
MDFSLIFTIALIFLVTSLVGCVRSRFTDRCLQSFQGFQVSLCRTDGREVWGRLDLNPGGIEITFPQRASGEPRVKSTYLLYAGEYTLIQSIFRHADRLTEAEQARRSADIARSVHPGPARRLRRRLRNFLGTATDSLREVLALVVGRVQKTQDRYVAAEGTDALTKLGGSVLTEVSSIHDPLLERQIGRQVVVEVIEGDEIHEHVGIFKEYSSDFLHLLDVEFPEPWTLDLAAGRPTEHAGMAAALGALLLKRQDHAEAGRWLRAAYNGSGILPDGGPRVLMQLRELSRRLTQRGHEGAGERALHESWHTVRRPIR